MSLALIEGEAEAMERLGLSPSAAEWFETDYLPRVTNLRRGSRPAFRHPTNRWGRPDVIAAAHERRSRVAAAALERDSERQRVAGLIWEHKAGGGRHPNGRPTAGGLLDIEGIGRFLAWAFPEDVTRLNIRRLRKRAARKLSRRAKQSTITPEPKGKM